IPIACMLPIVHVLRARPRATWTVVAVALALVPLTTWWWGGFAWREVRGDGTHEANHSVGWHTLRYFVLHGAYPLLPWVVLPLLGLRFARARSQRRQLLGWLLTGLVCVGAALLVDARWGDAYAGGVSAMLDVTWQPTSVPFVMLWGGASMAALATVYLLDVRWRVLAVVGRWSLPHYLVHLVVVYSSMRIWWPAEDWSWGVGAGVAVGYIATACLLATASPRPRCRGENHNR
ncbi:MAG: hypothetical protein KAI24_03100, partial [Planctomycetes bacterium]|nr:hypothetical protein [Planctomycetota bacterium]